MKTLARRLIVFLMLLVAWEGAARAGLTNAVIIASPSDMLAALVSDAGVFFSAFRLTLFEVVLALAIAWGAGIAVGLTAGSIPLLGQASLPLLSALMALPLVVIYPLIMAWVGIGPQSKIAYAALAGVAPIALNTIVGIRSIDRRYLAMARAVGAGAWQTRCLVLLPMALPAVVSGLRIGTSLTIIGVIVGEMLAASDGLGFWISYNRSLMNTGHVYLGIGLAVLMALGANEALSWLQRRLDGWRSLESGRRES